jgi:hypothetical protein
MVGYGSYFYEAMSCQHVNKGFGLNNRVSGKNGVDMKVSVNSVYNYSS